MTRNFGGRAKGAVGEFEWKPRPEEPQQPEGASSSGDGRKEAAADAQHSMAFKPVSVPRKGPMATFDKYPGEG